MDSPEPGSARAAESGCEPRPAVCSRKPHARPHRCPCPRWLPRGHKTGPARPFDFSKEARNLNFYIQKYPFLKPGK